MSRGGGGGFWVSTRGRRMTLTELGRIMGYKDHEMENWPVQRSKVAIGRMLGNAVPVPMIQGVLKSALATLGDA